MSNEETCSICENVLEENELNEETCRACGKARGENALAEWCSKCAEDLPMIISTLLQDREDLKVALAESLFGIFL